MNAGDKLSSAKEIVPTMKTRAPEGHQAPRLVIFWKAYHYFVQQESDLIRNQNGPNICQGVPVL